MEKLWYKNDFKEKYAYLQKLYSKETDIALKMKIKNTMRVIEINLAKERIPGDIEILLEDDYNYLIPTSFLWTYIRSVASIENDYKPKFSSDTTSFNKKDITELLHIFFKNGTTKEVYELFCKIYKENKKNIHFLEGSDYGYFGETIYLEYFRKTYIQVFKRYSFEDVTTFAHEFGHALQFNMNFHNNLYRNLNVYVEIISIFFELICNEYFVNNGFKKAATINSFSILDAHLTDAHNLSEELTLLDAIRINEFENKSILRNNIDILVSSLSSKDIEFLMYLKPSLDYIYVFAFLIATNLFIMYKTDLEKAFYMVNRIINLSGNITCKEYLEELEKMELLDYNKTIEYKELVCKRSRKLN